MDTLIGIVLLLISLRIMFKVCDTPHEAYTEIVGVVLSTAIIYVIMSWWR